MEESKKTKKVVAEKKATVKKEANEVKKLSYEELETAANQIAAQFDALRKENMNLRNQVQQLQLSDIYTELGFRFKVIESKDAFDPDFVDYCVNSIQEIMLPRKQETEDNQE